MFFDNTVQIINLTVRNLSFRCVLFCFVIRDKVGRIRIVRCANWKEFSNALGSNDHHIVGGQRGSGTGGGGETSQLSSRTHPHSNVGLFASCRWADFLHRKSDDFFLVRLPLERRVADPQSVQLYVRIVRRDSLGAGC